MDMRGLAEVRAQVTARRSEHEGVLTWKERLPLALVNNPRTPENWESRVGCCTREHHQRLHILPTEGMFSIELPTNVAT